MKDIENMKVCETLGEQAQRQNKLVAEALQLHSNPNIGAVENKIANTFKEDGGYKNAVLLTQSLKETAETTTDPTVKSTAYRDLAVMYQASALNSLKKDAEGSKLMLSDGSAKYIDKLEQLDPFNRDLKNLKKVQQHMTEAANTPENDRARNYNPLLDTTMLNQRHEQLLTNPIPNFKSNQLDGKALYEPIPNFDPDKVGMALGNMMSIEYTQAKNGNSIQSAARLQNFVDSQPTSLQDKQLMQSALNHADPEAATKLRRAMLNHSTIQFE